MSTFVEITTILILLAIREFLFDSFTILNNYQRIDENLAFTEITSTTNMHRMSAMAWYKGRLTLLLVGSDIAYACG